MAVLDALGVVITPWRFEPEAQPVPATDMLRFIAVAGVLGCGWFAVLLLPATTRGWLLEQPVRNATMLIVSSMFVAYGMRRFILSAGSFREHAKRALIVPYIGCLVYLTFVAAEMWIRQLLYGGLTNLHDTGSLFLMGTAAALWSFPVVIPYGLLCQLALVSAHEKTD